MRASMLRFLTTALILAGLGTWLAFEFRAKARLYDTVSPLREKALQLSQLSAENRRLRTDTTRLSVLRREQADLIQLLATKRAEATGQTAPGFKPAGEWRNSGNATPSEAYETYIWANDHADLSALASVLGMTSEAKAKVEAIFSSLPDDTRATYADPETMFALLYANRNPVWFSAMEVAEQDLQKDSFAILKVDVQYAGGQIREHNFYATHSTDGWKKAISDQEVDYTLSSQLGIEQPGSK